MSVHNYKSLRAHAGHKIVCVVYGDEDNVAIECEDCNEVLLDFDNKPDYELNHDKILDDGRVELFTYSTDAESTSDHISFSVPLSWLSKVVKERFNVTVVDFLDQYIWDDGELIMNWASEDDVLKILPEEEKGQ